MCCIAPKVSLIILYPYQSPAGQTDKADGVRLCAGTLSGASVAHGLAYPGQVSDH